MDEKKSNKNIKKNREKRKKKDEKLKDETGKDIAERQQEESLLNDDT